MIGWWDGLIHHLKYFRSTNIHINERPNHGLLPIESDECCRAQRQVVRWNGAGEALHRRGDARAAQRPKSLCPSSRGDPEDSETPPNINFLMSFGQENSHKQSGTTPASLN